LVTLPQSLRLFKATIVPMLLVSAFFATNTILAQDNAGTDEQRQTLFSCGTDEVDDRGFLDLNGIPLDYDSWTDLRFDRTANGDGHLIYSFPLKGVDPKIVFLFSHSDGSEGYLVSIRWKDGDTNYVYYSLNIPPDPAVEDDMGGGAGGLVISKRGKLIEEIGCDERPYMFISYMRHAMSCDVDNPYGPAACEETSIERTTPLDVTTIGIVP
jgi:hypothetical protein